jgi:hypothetical protein
MRKREILGHKKSPGVLQINKVNNTSHQQKKKKKPKLVFLLLPKF